MLLECSWCKKQIFIWVIQKKIKNCEILVISETHFNVRHKCPEGFSLIERSKVIESKSPRGGVAVYKNVKSELEFTATNDFLTDGVIVDINNSPITLIAYYIPPHNSAYFKNDSFDKLSMLPMWLYAFSKNRIYHWWFEFTYW